ncbi:hypothetical protein [Bifidobacterium platyrrhinorum]|uniref:Uncharacterized protein n=1 Tax=Bifidobacterium platyrrhinorum TaxID=2661628 RepID=A0A6L9STJ3_9BIFI|nr:hypothetical protein [Bifidobacterium platyrrhinorum]NEG54491.1 hypothetical protein [Bifidobacterium platyrrhinorum]
MPWINDSEFTHASVCMVYTEPQSDFAYFVRLMDYSSNDDQYTWVYNDTKPSERNKRPAINPYSLYHPNTINKINRKTTDFICLQWEANTTRPDRPLIADPYTYRYNHTPNVYEVIICPNLNTIEDVYKQLTEGLPYNGNPTRQLLVVYYEDNEYYNAILVSRDNCVFNHETIKIIDASRLFNRYILKKSDVHEIPLLHQNTITRYLYLSKTLHGYHGRVSLQPSQYYDAIITEKRDELTRLEERIRDRSASYERLGKLVLPLQAETDETNKKLETARAAITSIHKQQEIELAEFTRRKESELAELERRKTTELAELNQHKQAELAELEQQRKAVLDRLDEDVALRLGLKSVAESLMSSHAADGVSGTSIASDGDGSVTHLLRTVPYPKIPVNRSDERFTRVLANNLRAFGIVDTSKPRESPNELASACGIILSPARLLAVDSTFAADLANALSYTMRGEPARHATVPVDWNDARALDRLLSDTGDGVLVLDNVFDTVNESLLFALSRLRSESTIILPIGAYGNLRLVAAEVWDHVFYLPTERYVKLPATPTTMQRFASAFHRSETKWQMAFDTATAMQEHTSLPLSSLMLPAAVSARFPIPGDGRQWTSAHLALQTYAAFGLDRARTIRIDGKEPPSVKELLSRIERGRNGR